MRKIFLGIITVMVTLVSLGCAALVRPYSRREVIKYTKECYGDEITYIEKEYIGGESPSKRTLYRFQAEQGFQFTIDSCVMRADPLGITYDKNLDSDYISQLLNFYSQDINDYIENNSLDIDIREAYSEELYGNENDDINGRLITTIYIHIYINGAEEVDDAILFLQYLHDLLPDVEFQLNDSPIHTQNIFSSIYTYDVPSALVDVYLMEEDGYFANTDAVNGYKDFVSFSTSIKEKILKAN